MTGPSIYYPFRRNLANAILYTPKTRAADK